MFLKMCDENPSVFSNRFAEHESERAKDIEAKHRIVAEFLKSHRYDALLLQSPTNFAWFTSGGDCTRGGVTDTVASLFITPDARVLACNNADSSQLFEREFPNLGFLLKERPWHEPRRVLLDDLCYGRTVASDNGFNRTNDVSVYLKSMRLTLGAVERERIRELSRHITHAVEATARRFKKGRTEAEIAGEVVHRLVKHQIQPVRIQVRGDGRSERYRHWSFSNQVVGDTCTIAAIGSASGLHAGAVRTVCFGNPSQELVDAHHHATIIQLVGMHFSTDRREVCETWKRVSQTYDKLDRSHEWQMNEQAEIIGYELSEASIVPDSEFQLSSGMVLFWHPSVGPAMTGDTILVNGDSFDLLTAMEDWPRITVEAGDKVYERPGILKRQTRRSSRARKRAIRRGSSPREIEQEDDCQDKGHQRLGTESDTVETETDSNNIERDTSGSSVDYEGYVFDEAGNDAVSDSNVLSDLDEDGFPGDSQIAQVSRVTTDTAITRQASDSTIVVNSAEHHTNDPKSENHQTESVDQAIESLLGSKPVRDPATFNRGNFAAATASDSRNLRLETTTAGAIEPATSGFITGAPVESATTATRPRFHAAAPQPPTITTAERKFEIDLYRDEYRLEMATERTASPEFIEPAIDINTADWPEWAQLAGVSQSLARAIVADRNLNGPFRNADDLTRVRGIGLKTVDRIRHWLA